MPECPSCKQAINEGDIFCLYCGAKLRIAGAGSKGQRENLVRQLIVFRDRLLQVDWRNRAILLRKIYKKWSVNLADFPEAAPRILDKVLAGSGGVALVLDSDLSDEATEKRLAIIQLHRTERQIEEETGLHDFFIGFPFIEGHLTSDHYVRAPLVLFPARIEHTKVGHGPGWHLVVSDEIPPIWNHVFLAAARKVAGMSAPPDMDERLYDLLEELRSGKENLVGSFLEEVQRLLVASNYPIEVQKFQGNSFQKLDPLNEEILSQLPRQGLHLASHIVFGSFQQASNAIYLDYEELIERARQGESDQGLINNLLEAPSDEIPPTHSLYDASDKPLDKIPDRELNFVLPSDGSQDGVILEAQQAPCVVVRGPPGTGKSQVIVNLISNALWKGQRVLLVCQKRAALDVVSQRLDKVGLAQYAVLLHSERVDRSKVYKDLHRLLSEGFDVHSYEPLAAELQRLSAEIDETIQRLNQIADPLNKEYFGVRLHQLYLLVDPKYTSRFDTGGIERQLNYVDVKHLIDKIAAIERGCKRFDQLTYPLCHRVSFAMLGQTDRVRFQQALQASIQKTHCDYLFSPSMDYTEKVSRDLRFFVDISGKPLRWLRGSWWTHGRAAADFLRAQHSPATSDYAKQWINRISHGRELLISLQNLGSYFSSTGYNELLTRASDPTSMRTQLTNCLSALGEFDDIQQHDARIMQLAHHERDLVSACKRQLMNAEDWANVVFQEICFRWVDSIEKANPALKGKPFEAYLELRETLSKLMERKRAIQIEALRSKLDYQARTPVLPPGNYHPNRTPRTDWNKLAYEFGKKKRLKPLRKLFEEFTFQLNRIVSCWLVSPETVSSVFPLERAIFDLVIFDEASQLAVERALPTLYRGKRIVIAGDEKQLRPFDLFQIREEEGEEEIPEPLTTESLLLLAMRIFGSRYLRWHYRSKYQELIDFSNHAFYDGQLEIAPSTFKNPPSPPIKWIQCMGYWNERRQNLTEASRALDLLTELLKTGVETGHVPSIGICTFNDPQQEAILDEIDSRRSRFPDFEALMALAENPASGNLDDRLFVKNIENVQGDERDVIIFSIGYGRDVTGRLRAQFGSLNVEGGENRLNVAITRAREQVFVICSFDPAELKTEETANLGPKLLKHYLRYSNAVSNNQGGSVETILSELNSDFAKQQQKPLLFESPLEEQVHDALTGLGYAIDTQVGFSGYRIDLAVIHPKNPSRYILAIECDGETFHSARSARERDVHRQKFLESRGWKVERVWSRNWWRNRDAEIKRLDSAIQKLC